VTGGKLKEICIRSESCTVPWKEIKYFCYNPCQKDLVFNFLPMVVFSFQLLSRCQRSEGSFSFASKKTHFLIAPRASNSHSFLRNWAEKSCSLLACPAHVCTSIPDLFGWRASLSDVMLSSQTLSHSGTLFISRCCCLFSGS